MRRGHHLVRGESLATGMSRYLIDQIEQAPKHGAPTRAR
jgi:hypothetical protein